MTAIAQPKRALADRRDQSSTVTDNFEALFLEHWPRVYGVLVRLVGDPAEAEDLALETFWRLSQRTDTRELNLGGWLYRVASNLGLNALRSWQRRAAYEQANPWEAENRAGTDPLEIIIQNENRARVRQALRALSPRSAQLLILRHSGLSYQELAAALGVSPTSIGTLLARAEKEFADHWQKLEGDATP